MRKKLSLIFVLTFCCLCLSGCGIDLTFGIKDMLESFSRDTQSVDMYDMLADDANYPQSESTVRAGDKLAAASNKMQGQEVGNWWQAMWSKNICTESTMTRYEAKYNKALDNYNSTKARDKIFQQAKASANSSNSWATGPNGWDISIIIIIIRDLFQICFNFREIHIRSIIISV